MTILTETETATAGDPPTVPAVAVQRLVKTYPHPDGGTFNAVDDLSFTVAPGEGPARLD